MRNNRIRISSLHAIAHPDRMVHHVCAVYGGGTANEWYPSLRDACRAALRRFERTPIDKILYEDFNAGEHEREISIDELRRMAEDYSDGGKNVKK